MVVLRRGECLCGCGECRCARVDGSHCACRASAVFAEEREGKRASTGQSWMAFSSHGERESFGPRTEHFAAHK